MPDHPARPRLHLTPRTGWINDPLGLTAHDGRYHLFFQQVPDRTTWAAEQHWGHAVSTDLLHWDELDPALSPGDGDDGVWSGSLVVPPQGDPAIFYTSARGPQTHLARPRLARPVDASWATWSKGPLLADLPADLDLVAVRDPYVVHDGTSWLMLLGAGLADGTATALTYRSDDLEAWRYDGLLAGRHTSRTDPWTGDAWECPQLFPLGDRWVLVVSVWREGASGGEAYAVGDLVDGRFHAERWEPLTYGPSLYAGSAFVDADRGRGLIHWLRGVEDPAGRWAGAHSLPHALDLVDDRLVVRPHDAVAAARGASARTASGGRTTLDGPADVVWTLEEPGATAGLVLGAGPSRVDLAVEGGRLVARLGDESWEMPVVGPELRVVVDGPVVEVFGGAGVLAVVAPVTGPRDVEVRGRCDVVVHELA